MTGKNGRTRSRASSTSSPASAPDCASLTDVTSIASPNPAELAKIAVGSVLGVELRSNPQTVVATSGPAVVGALVPMQLVNLINCLKRGHRFSATVLRIEGGYCEVHIRCTGQA